MTWPAAGSASVADDESNVDASESWSSSCMSNELLLRALVPARAPVHPEFMSGSTVLVGHCISVLAAVMIWPFTLLEYRSVNGRSAAFAVATGVMIAAAVTMAAMRRSTREVFT